MTAMNKRRFRNYVRGLIRRNQINLNDRQLYCAADSYGLDLWTMNRILNEEGY